MLSYCTHIYKHKSVKCECVYSFRFCPFISIAFRTVLHVVAFIEHPVVLFPFMFGQKILCLIIIPRSVFFFFCLWQNILGINNGRFLCSLFSDIFSQISDSSGTMVFAKFDQFLREVLKLPTAVFEGPSFGYTEHSVRTCFPQQVRVSLAQHLLMVPNWSCFYTDAAPHNWLWVSYLCFARRRYYWTPSWTLWWPIHPRSASFGYLSCTDWPM